MEVVINTCFGGFDLSEEAKRKLKQLLSVHRAMPRVVFPWDTDYEENLLDNILYTPVIFYRANKHLVRIVKEMGEKASKRYSNLEVIDIPEDAINPYISDCDGMEHVAEGRIWR